MLKIWVYFVLTLITLTLNLKGTMAQSETMSEDNSVVDLETISCRDLLKLNDEDKRSTIIFFHGYMSGKQSDLTADVDVLGEISNQVIDYCIDNPDDTLMSVFNRYRGLNR
jgi:hypothetical protein